MAVSPASFSAMRNDNRCFIHDICHDLTALCILDNGSYWNFDDKIRCTLTKAAVCSAVLAVLCDEFSFILKVNQGVDALATLQYNVSAASAVSAVRTSRCNKLFSVERNCTVSAGTCLYFNRSFINKHSFRLFSSLCRPHFILCRAARKGTKQLYITYSLLKELFGKPTWLRLAKQR